MLRPDSQIEMLTKDSLIPQHTAHLIKQWIQHLESELTKQQFKIDWSLAPEGTVAIVQDQGHWRNITWLHKNGNWWNDNNAEWSQPTPDISWVQTIAIRPPTCDEYDHITPSGLHAKIIFEDKKTQVIEYPDGVRSVTVSQEHYAVPRKKQITEYHRKAILQYELDSRGNVGVAAANIFIKENYEVI